MGGLSARCFPRCLDFCLIVVKCCDAGARESIRFLPPLNVKEEEIAKALGILEESLEEVFNEGHPSSHQFNADKI